MKAPLLISIALFFSGCTHGDVIPGEDVWYIDKIGFSDTLFYCRANKTDSKALPICYEARVLDRHQAKPRQPDEK